MHTLSFLLPLTALALLVSAPAPAGEPESSRPEPPRHWAWVAPERPALPAVKDTRWPRNPIDRFVLARLEREGLRPEPPAGRAVLLRRVALDLTGIPPSLEEVERFLADTGPGAWERAVDRLLSSPRYGERWAVPWLDLARYADSNGYQRDGFREIWGYRDWVVRALNEDLPYHRFTVEQVAGDLLPGATIDEKIATGFSRATTINVEAGTNPEADRTRQVTDRVNVAATVFLGVTLECAQCHDHKYDPFTLRDYYRLYAYFNNTPIESRYRGKDTAALDFTGAPAVTLPLDDESRRRREELRRELRELELRLAAFAENEEPLAAADGSGGPSGTSESSPEPPSGAVPKAEETETNAASKELREEISRVRKALRSIRPPTSLVMEEIEEPRETRVLERGDFRTPGDVVEPGVPAALHPLPERAPPNRLGLARWLADRSNPLLARAAVNRWWAEVFGRGLVATPEDLGTRGEPPSHPALLDWLAVELRETGSMKRIHRLMVTSAAYRQSSRVSEEKLRRDPRNVLLSRGARVRLPAETIRDAALSASGLLAEKIGGPPVYPPQPPGVWRVVGKVDNTYRTSEGEDRYRRSLYTIWRRSAPYPSLATFDAPNRDACVVRRPRTNTPLQALTLLNDPVYVECAVALARRIVEELPRGSPAARARLAFRRVLAREPSPPELHHLVELAGEERARLESRPASERPADIESAEVGAWFFVATVLLNLDETITRG